MASGRKSYFEKLKDPRWQKKRLVILQRADFTCEWCGEKERTLHVHHGYYERTKDPWDYADDTLRCLCDECHEMAGALMAEAHEAIARIWCPDILCEIPGTVELLEDAWPFGLTKKHPEKSRFTDVR